MKKKKILILANDFPPYVSVGAMRPYGWAKYLPEDKWEVTVVTRHWDEGIQTAIDCVKSSSKQVSEITSEEGYTVVRVPYKANIRDRLIIKYGLNKFVLIRKAFSFIIDFFKHDFFIFDSTKEIFFEANKLLTKESFDLIIATGEPFILFRYASLLSIRHKIKWVGDYRDGWTTNQRKARLGFSEKLLLKKYRRKELKYISSSSLITTAANEYKAELKKFISNKDIEVVLNGFISNSNDLLKINKSCDIFEISYLGTLYDHQNVESFIQGLELFIKDNNISTNEFKVNFIGMKFYTDQKERVIKCSKIILPYLNFTDKISYNELPKFISNTSLLLLFSKKGMNWLNAKIFDYLLFNRRVLFIGNDFGVLEKILKESKNTTLYANDIKEIKYQIESAFNEYKSQSYLFNSNDKNEVFKYSRENQTIELARLLDEL